MFNNTGSNSAHKKNDSMFAMSIFYEVFFFVGMDFGFFRFKIVPVKLMKCFAFIVSVALNCVIFIYIGYGISGPWFVFEFIKFHLFNLHLMFLKDHNSFCNLYYELFLIDSKCNIDSLSFNAEFKILCSNVIYICFKLCLVASYNLVNTFVSQSTSLTVLLFAMTVSTDILLISYAYIFYLIKIRLRKLSDLLEKSEFGYKTHQYSYKFYVDVVDKYKRAFDPVMVMALCSAIPEVLLNMYTTLKDWTDYTMLNIIAMVYHYTFTILLLVLTLLPAISAGMLCAETERIKLILNDKFIEETDELKVCEIEQFIQYVKARGCHFRVYKLLPLDLSLFVMVVSFCATYLIVILQFTKLY